MRKAASVAAFVLIYLGAANAALSIVVGTCTQGSADELMSGILSAGLYGLALACLLYGRPHRQAFAFLIPIAAVLGWQTYFSIKFFVGYHAFGLSACQIKTGEPYEMDGRESLLAWLWLGMNLWLTVGLLIAYRRGAASSAA